MNKRTANGKLSKVARLTTLVDKYIENDKKPLTTKIVSDWLGCNEPNANKYLNNISFLFDIKRIGRQMFYSFKEEILTNFNAEKFVSQIPQKKKDTKTVVIEVNHSEEFEAEIAKLKEEIKSLKSQLVEYEHLKVSLRAILL